MERCFEVSGEVRRKSLFVSAELSGLSKFPISSRVEEKGCPGKQRVRLAANGKWPCPSNQSKFVWLYVCVSVRTQMVMAVKTFKTNQICIDISVCPEVVGLLHKYFDRELGWNYIWSHAEAKNNTHTHEKTLDGDLTQARFLLRWIGGLTPSQSPGWRCFDGMPCGRDQGVLAGALDCNTNEEESRRISLWLTQICYVTKYM